MEISYTTVENIMEMYNPDKQGTLLKETLVLLRKCKTPAHVIFAETGLPYYWIKDMKQGKSSDPSVNRIQYLYEYLSQKSLAV